MDKILKISIVAVLGVFVFSGCTKVQQGKPLVYNPEKTVAGEQTIISYNSKLTNLAGEEEIKAVVYFWQNYHWIANDLPLKQKSGLWKGEFDVPDNAALVALKFVAGDKVDMSGSNMYVTFSVAPDSSNISSAYIGWGLLRAEGFEQYSIPHFSDTIKVSNDVMRYWCNQEILHSPDERKHVAYYGAKALAQTDKANRFAIIEADVSYMLHLDSLGEVTESDLMNTLENTKRILHNDSLAKILKERMLEKYPDGILARDKEILRIFRFSGSIEDKAKAMQAFVKRFPFAKFRDTPTEAAYMYLGKNFQSVVYNQIIKHDDYGLLKEYIHEVPYSYLTTFFWHIIQIPYSRGDVKTEKLRPYADLLIDEAINRPQSIDQMVYSPIEWNNRFYETRKDALLDYAKVMDETGDTNKAFALMQRIASNYKGKSAKFSDFYITMLEKTGNSSQILPVVIAGVKENAATPEMIEILKEDYIRKHKSDDGFNEYLNSLKLGDQLEALKEEVASSLIDKPIELFELEKLNGGTVDMAKLKGKTIVLDFWATWCGPCKAAMPGMQMVVDKYKNDENVVFFFVSTMEYSPDFKQQIEKLLTENKYDFTVLLDNKNPESGKRDYLYSTYAKAFHFSGIPQKMIIDANGKLRWRSTGYNGSPSELSDEISCVIELLKNEK